MLVANTKGRMSTLAVDDNLDMNGRNVTNADVVSVNEHVTLVGARFPGKGFRHVERDGWSMSKDNGDVERKFWKDDFSVDSSSQYTVVTGSVTYDTDHIIVTSDSQFYPSVLEGVPCYGARLHVKQPGVSGIMANGTNSISVNFGSDFSSNQISVIFYNGGNNTDRITATIHIHGLADLTYFNIAIFESSEDYFAFLANGYTIDLKIFNDGTFTISVPETSFSRLINSYPIDVSKLTTCMIRTWNLKKPVHIYSLDVFPSVSYADDFTTDTVTGANGRYQAVTGTVAYDDVNKRMTITAGAGVMAKTRLKSYKQLEGAYKRKLHLPATGTDGDVVAAYFGTEPTLESGFGIGAIRTAGAWNIATIDGATVTDTGTVIADLVDGDSFYVEVERDTTHGVVWYYVYKSGKPTPASGKLFNTYQEIYDGFWFKNNGAAENSIAVSEIEDRAESIVGRTNVQVEEPFWFRDEFNEDSLGRWLGPKVSVTISDGKLLWGNPGIYLYFPLARFKEQTISFTWTPTSASESSGRYRIAIGFCETYPTTELFSDSGNKYILYFMPDSSALALYKNGVSYKTNWGLTGITLGGTYNITITKSGGTFNITVNDKTFSFIDDSGTPIIESSYVALMCPNVGTIPHEIDDLQISGTRVYNKPIHRGAMLETYHDGTQEVVGTTYINDMNWDAGELTLDKTTGGTWAIDTTEGVLKVSTGADARAGCSIRNVKIIDGYWRFRFNSSITFQFGILQQTPITDSSSVSSFHNGGGYILKLNNGSFSLYTSTTTHLGTVVLTLTYNANYLCEFIKIGNRFTLYLTDSNGIVQTATWTDPNNLFTTSLGVCNFFQHYPSSTTKIWDFVAIGIDSDATNGIAACIPPIGGGARYGVEEEVYFDIDNEVKYNESVVLATVKTLDPANEGVEMFFGNTTDSSKITTDDTDVEVISLEDASYKDVVKEIVLNYDDRGDEIKVGVRKTGDNVATVYVETLAVVPKVEVV